MHPILLVEDDENDVLLIRRAFRRARVANPLDVVGDGEAAVTYLTERATGDRTERPQVVLLDLKLPRRSGLEVLEWIRGRSTLQSVPVVVLTSSRQQQDVERAYALGANSYLVKPASSDSLREMIDALGIYWLVLNQTRGAADDD